MTLLELVCCKSIKLKGNCISYVMYYINVYLLFLLVTISTYCSLSHSKHSPTLPLSHSLFHPRPIHGVLLHNTSAVPEDWDLLFLFFTGWWNCVSAWLIILITLQCPWLWLYTVWSVFIFLFLCVCFFRPSWKLQKDASFFLATCLNVFVCVCH